MIQRGDLSGLAVCPVCHGALSDDRDELACIVCARRYPVYRGVPILLHPESRYFGKIKPSPPTAFGGVARAIIASLPSRQPMTTWLDRTLFNLLAELAPDVKILNLGSGQGTFDRYIPEGISMINLDVTLSERADLVADGHYLPFADSSLDAVFSNAVLEHVERPWIVAEEIWRVLRPGGRAYINVPFLNVIHDTEDYFRFTDQGLRVLFARFEQVSAGVSAGPSSFLGPFLIEYLLCFVPTRPLQLVMKQLFSVAAWPLKYADYLIRNNPRIRITADAFYFVGVKR